MLSDDQCETDSLGYQDNMIINVKICVLTKLFQLKPILIALNKNMIIQLFSNVFERNQSIIISLQKLKSVEVHF